MKKAIKQNIGIIIILLIAAFLYIYKIWGEGYANEYYAAGVYSMSQNLHAFFFNSLDSAGFVTIDKPPLGFWIQVVFVKLFGFSGAVLVLPEAISGILSVYLIYRIIKKRFSKAAGLAAALVLAFTPIFAAVSRNNTIDGILILLLVLAAEQAIKAAENSKGKHLIYAAIIIGLGFNVKMLQAFMIVPAVYLTYLIFSKQKIAKKLLISTLSVLILLAISLSWVVAVDLIDEQNRPYVGSSETNSAIELALGYNGLNRLLGRNSILGLDEPQNDGAANRRPYAAQGQSGIQNAPYNANNAPFRQVATGQNNPSTVRNPQRQGGVAGEAGETSLIRLFNDKNAGQISWFILPAALSALAAFVLVFIKRFRQDKRFALYFFFAASLIPMYLYFSFAQGVTHRYYFAMMAPSISALAGIAYYVLTKAKKKIVIPAVFTAIALVQIYIHSLYAGWMDWLVPLSVLIFIAAIIAMAVLIFKNVKSKHIVILMSVLLIIPAVWAVSPVLYNDNSQLPIAGPELINQRDSFDDSIDLSGVVDYLTLNRNGADYIAVTESSMQLGAELILQSGEAVMVLGGFNGGDEVLTLDEFIESVKDGIIRYALISQGGGQRGNAEILQWVRNNASVVPPQEYGGRVNNIVLYKLG